MVIGELLLNVGDTRPQLVATLTDGIAGTPVNLTAAAAITVTVVAANGSTRYTRTCTGTSAGVVTVPWQAGDTASSGELWVQFKVTWPDGTVQSFPAGGQLVVQIVPNI